MKCLRMLPLALTLLSLTPAFTQVTNPLAVTLEAYVVTVITKEDGATEEHFTEATEVEPGQVIEFRLLVQNQGEATLPTGTVMVTGPVPAGTRYLANSATPSSDVARTAFTADGGQTFSEPPVIITIVNADGEPEEVIAPPEQYTAVRWVVLTPLEPAQTLEFSYRVTVQ